MMNRLLGLGIALVLALSATPALAQDIDTGPGSMLVGPFGYGLTATYGQTFTAPPGVGKVNSFTFRTHSVPAGATFRGFLMAWDAASSRATGPILFESADANTTGPTYQDVTFVIPGGAAVTPGQTYVIFASRVNSVGVGSGDWRHNNDVLPGGNYVFQSSAGAGDFTGAAWAQVATIDLAVAINFAPAAPAPPPAAVPTLSEWAMILLGLMLAGAGALWVTRRRGGLI